MTTNTEHRISRRSAIALATALAATAATAAVALGGLRHVQTQAPALQQTAAVPAAVVQPAPELED